MQRKTILSCCGPAERWRPVRTVRPTRTKCRKELPLMPPRHRLDCGTERCRKMHTVARGANLTCASRVGATGRRVRRVRVTGYESLRAKVPLSRSFWENCTELRSASIGRWLIDHRLAPWQRSVPPTLELDHVADRLFRLQEPR
jgi:hypothetical protein